MRPADEPRRLLVLPLVIAALAVGLAIQLQNGEYSPAAIGLITFAIVAIATSISDVWRAVPANPLTDGRCPSWVLLAAVWMQISLLLLSNTRRDLPLHYAPDPWPFQVGVIVAGLLVGLLARDRGWRPIVFAGLLVCFVALGSWMIRSTPAPHIDVWMFQQGASAELLHGRNPYALTFPDIYHSTLPQYPQKLYGPGLVINDRLQFGFPYPPVSLLMAIPGYLLAGDHRYSQLAALAIAAVLVASSSRREHSRLFPGERGWRTESSLCSMSAALLLIFTPRVFFVLGQGWTEPFAVLLLATTIFLAVRNSRWLPLALGLFLATKQYLLVAVPLTFFLLPEGWRWRDWAKLLALAGAVAVVVTLPFALWDFAAFWKSTVTVQAIAPFRWDSLSYIVWWGFHGHGEQVKQPGYALLPSIVAAMAALVLSLWRAPRTPAGFAASLALISIVFFAFNKQAFCNYYFFVIGAVCCAVGAAATSDRHNPSFGRAEYVSGGSNPSHGSELGVRNRSA